MSLKDRVKGWVKIVQRRRRTEAERVREVQHLRRLEEVQRRKVIQRRRAAVERRGHPDAEHQAALLEQAQEALQTTRVRIDRAEEGLLYTRKELAAAEAQLAKLRAGSGTLQQKAWKIAEGLVGVMEQGGNNMGPMVSRIIRENNGTVGESWCGDFVAYCYRHAGSQAVDRSWAGAWAVENDPDVQITNSPTKGDLVNYSFGEGHVGLFGSKVNGSTIATIEGNTGPVGATSDSATGGDGVYAKRRSTSLVRNYIRVLR